MKSAFHASLTNSVHAIVITRPRLVIQFRHRQVAPFLAVRRIGATSASSGNPDDRAPPECRVVRLDAQLTARRKSIGSSRIVIRTVWSMFITSPPTSRSRCGFDDTSSASDVDSESITGMENGKVLDQPSGTDGAHI